MSHVFDVVLVTAQFTKPLDCLVLPGMLSGDHSWLKGFLSVSQEVYQAKPGTALPAAL